jgi:prepilin-type N-terminal cleavage/methylation domain-containing protein
MKGQKGFTLIELIIVIAIIAILAAVAIPNYLAFRDRANISAAKDALGSLRTALEAYAADTGYYIPSGETTKTDIDYLAPNYIDNIAKLTGSWASETYAISKTDYTVTVTAKDRGNTQVVLTLTGISP